MEIAEILDTVICGDALEVLKEIPNGSVNCIVTSPPYDNMRDYRGYVCDIPAIQSELARVLIPGGVCVWVAGDQTINGSETGSSFRQALRFLDLGLRLHDTMIYLKDGFAFPEANRYQPVFEYMFVVSKGRPRYFAPIKRRTKYGAITELEHERQRDGTISTGAYRYQLEVGNCGNVWLYGTGYGKTTTDKIAYEHPCAFPEQLAADHIYTWTVPGDIVLDCFGGSGTTCKIARLLGRHYIGIDISPEYCEMARRRIAAIPPSLFEETVEESNGQLIDGGICERDR